MLKIHLCATGLLLAAGSIVCPAQVTFTEYPIPTAAANAGAITTGADGNLWFAELAGNKIGKVTTSGAITEYAIPTSGAYPTSIAQGPDGNVWFTEAQGNKIGKITPAGSITEYSNSSVVAPNGITSGPDGNLWFVNLTGLVGKITTAGVFTIVTQYPAAETNRIVLGPDGNLWFTGYATDPNAGFVAKLTTDGTVTAYPANAFTFNITVGPDGNLWFTGPFEPNDKIGKITTGGVATAYPMTANTRAYDIATGPDGNLWFTDDFTSSVGRITTSGVITEFGTPTPLSRPMGITRGPDGNIWFTEGFNQTGGNRIGKLVLSPLPGTPAQSVTISSNFGPSGTFNPSIGWGFVGPTQLAYPFTVPGNANYAFESASLALSRGIGPNNSFTASLAADAGGVPGSILETFPVFALQSYPNDTVPVTVTSSLLPLLKSGSVYWLIVSATFSGNGVNWLTANILTTPDLQASQSSPTSAWMSSPLLYGYNYPGALSVSGVSLIPQLSNPPYSATGVSPTPTLTWSASIGAISYDVYLGTSSSPAFVGTTTNTSYAPPPLLPNQTYYWQIVAHDSLGMNPSAVWSFTTVDASCSFSANPSAVLINYAGGPASVSVTAGTGCAWMATSDSLWLTISSGSSGTGAGTIFLSANANTGSAQLAHLKFANLSVGVMQGGSPAVQIFNDVPPTDPYFDYISVMASYGITLGCQAGPPLYCPDLPITRAQMAALLVRAYDVATGSPLTFPVTPYFQDVPASGVPDSIYYGDVQKLAQLGITLGCQSSPALFCPDQSVSQGQMAAFMIRSWMLLNNITLLTYPATPLTDVPATDLYFSFVQKMVQLGFWTGCGSGSYCENSAVSRDQMAPMIMRAMLGAP
jgi:virginiamycin B lyase